MRRECQHCHRGYMAAGTEGAAGVSHGVCGRCHFIFEVKQQADEDGVTLGEMFSSDKPEHQALLAITRDTLAKELSGEEPWEGVWPVPVPLELKPALKILERQVGRELNRENERRGPRPA